MSIDNSRAYFTVAQLAERWGVSERSIYRRIKDGLVKSGVGGSSRFAPSDVDDYEQRIRQVKDEPAPKKV